MLRKLSLWIQYGRKSNRKLVLFGACVSILLVAAIFHSMGMLSSDLHPNITRKRPRSIAAGILTLKESTVRPKLILYWTKRLFVEDFGVGYGKAPFENCPTQLCLTTSNRSLLNVSDAVIFHTPDTYFTDIPPYRLPHQLWIFYNTEPPRFTPALEKFSNTFNWTMTYRLDSDIHHPYGRVLPFPSIRKQTQEYLHKHQPAITKWMSNLQDFRQMKETLIEGSPNVAFDYDAFTKAKKKSVAWFVSDCRSGSNRAAYVHELAQYIDIDIYGKCGNLTCADRKSCFEMVGRDYKFYLALENSICKDYVTEKLFNSLIHGVVPVVFAVDAHRQVAPPNSFVDADAFESPKALAEYLNTLIKNDTLYNQYLKWNDNFKPTKADGWCSLCQLLNSHNVSYDRPAYKDLHDWWFDKAECEIRDPADTTMRKLVRFGYPVLGFVYKLGKYLKE